MQKRFYIFDKDPQTALLWMMSHVYKPLHDEENNTVMYNYGNSIEYFNGEETEIISFDEFINLFKNKKLEYLPED